MKYIRTKDGRIGIWNKTGSIFFPPNLTCVYAYFNDYTDKHLQMLCSILKNDFHTEMITQADTIEELCDVCIIKGEFGIYIVSFKELDKHAMGQTKEMLLSGQLEAYGAIWIIDSNGVPTLKPVAKANKKGKLELL